MTRHILYVLQETGSYDYHEAVARLREQGHGVIEVIDENTGNCIGEIRYEDIEPSRNE